MQKRNALVIGGAILTSTAAGVAEGHDVLIKDLDAIGISSAAVVKSFQNSIGIDLGAEDVVKVSLDEEGKHLDMVSLGSISIRVPIDTARPGPNKITHEP